MRARALGPGGCGGRSALKGSVAARRPITFGGDHLTHKHPVRFRADLAFTNIAICSYDVRMAALLSFPAGMAGFLLFSD